MTLNLKIKLQNNTQPRVLYLELGGGNKSEHVKNRQVVQIRHFTAQMPYLNKKLTMPGYDYHSAHFCTNMNKNFKEAWAKKTTCVGCGIIEYSFCSFLYVDFCYCY